ncbi:hypothetical protein C8B47_21855 [filamentous cyanobacterium CCP4]|nr:hypothetical protein C8B47_21855 [filamentous cyanobacterium CCP4]
MFPVFGQTLCGERANISELEQWNREFVNRQILEPLQDFEIGNGVEGEGYVSQDEILLHRIAEDGTVDFLIVGRHLEDIQTYFENDEGYLVTNDTYNDLIIETLQIASGERSYGAQVSGGDPAEEALDRIFETLPYLSLNEYVMEGQSPEEYVWVFVFRNPISKAEFAYKEAEDLEAEGAEDALRNSILKYEQSLELLQDSSLDELGNSIEENSSRNDQDSGNVYEENLRQLKEAILLYEQNRYGAVVDSSYTSPFERNIMWNSGTFRSFDLDQGDTLVSLGRVHEKLGEFQKALNYYNRSISHYESSENTEDLHAALLFAADIYKKLGQLEQANSYYEKVLLESIKELETIESTLNNAVAALEDSQLRETELAFAEAALARGDYGGAGRSYLSAAALTFRRSQFPEETIEYLDRSLALYRQAGNYSGQAAALTYLTRTYDLTGYYDKAEGYFEQSLQSWEQANYQHTEEGTFWNQNLSSFGLNSFQERRRDLIPQIAGIYQRMGRYEEEIEYFKRALIANISAPPTGDAAVLLSQIAARYYEQLSQPQEALYYLNHALNISKSTGYADGEGWAAVQIGWIHWNGLKQPQEAFNYFKQALESFKRSEDIAAQAQVNFILSAIASQEFENLSEALAHATESIRLSQASGDRSIEVEALSIKGIIEANTGNPMQAITTLQAATDALESFRNDIQVSEFASAFIAQQSDVYDLLFNLLWQEGRYIEAFDVAERIKARSFLDQMANEPIDVFSDADAQLLEEEQFLSRRLVELNRQLTELQQGLKGLDSQEEISRLTAELAMAQRNYQTLLTEIQVRSPEVASLVSVDTLPLTELQSQLDANTTLVEYVVTENQTFAFVVTRDEVKAITLVPNRIQLQEAITSMRGGFANLNNPHPQTLQQLHEWLVQPLLPYLQNPHLTIVPDKVLHYLPFAALSDGNRHLVDDYAISYLPSANTLEFLPKSLKTELDSALVIGDPDLEGVVANLPILLNAIDEAVLVAQIFETTPLLVGKATETEFRSAATDASVIHLATHGRFDTNNPLFSTLFFAQDGEAGSSDGRLEVREVYGLNLKEAPLVVLSACETNVGQLNQGDEIIGLNRAFHYAGASTVMASLWNVDDASTGQLMTAFYRYLEEGMTRAEALREAQLDIREDFPHPFYWAPFTLSGQAGD